MPAGGDTSFRCSNFNSYCNTELVEIAVRVIDEFNFHECSSHDRVTEPEADANDENEEEYEFTFTTRESELASPVSPAQIFRNGMIRPVYPVYVGGSLQNENDDDQNGVPNLVSSDDPEIRLPSRNLLIGERESSEADRHDVMCRPNGTEAEKEEDDEGRSEKSSSTGCKRWQRLRKLVHKSRNQGSRRQFPLLHSQQQPRKTKVKESPVDGGKARSAAPPPPPYDRLPYRQDLEWPFGNEKQTG